jgi:hypothetical protein
MKPTPGAIHTSCNPHQVQMLTATRVPHFAQMAEQSMELAVAEQRVALLEAARQQTMQQLISCLPQLPDGFFALSAEAVPASKSAGEQLPCACCRTALCSAYLLHTICGEGQHKALIHGQMSLPQCVFVQSYISTSAPMWVFSQLWRPALHCHCLLACLSSHRPTQWCRHAAIVTLAVSLR